MKICGIYTIQNTVNGKVYVGSSQDIERRWRRHRNELDGNRHHSAHLQRAWNVDGSQAFLFSVIEKCSLEELTSREQEILTAYKASEPALGYNVSAVVGSRRGVKHSEEAKLKMRQAAKSRPPKDDDYKRRHSELMKVAAAEGRLFSEEHRRRISEGQMGKKKSAEAVQKMRENCGCEPTVFVNVDGELLTVKDAAKHFGIAESSMRKRLRTGNAVRVDIRSE